MPPKLIVVSSPSGGGKSTIIRQLLELDKNLAYSISATTRKPRTGEEDGKHYHFFDQKRFEKMIEQKAFLEWALVHGDLYGTIKDEVNHHLSNGHHVLLDIDVQGGIRLREENIPSLFIFLLPPSLKILESRLRKRKTEPESAIAKRLAVAKEEMNGAEAYDYLVINKNLDLTIEEVNTIIRSRSNQ
jgi:guanylate kinase